MAIVFCVLAALVFAGSFLLTSGVNLTNGLLAAVFLMLWAIVAQISNYASRLLRHLGADEPAPKHQP